MALYQERLQSDTRIEKRLCRSVCQGYLFETCVSKNIDMPLINSPCILQCTQASPVSLKVLLCILFMFFNRAQRVLRSESMIVTHLDYAFCSMLPLFASATLHTALLFPALVVPTRVGRIAVLCALLHVLLLHALSMLFVAMALQTYMTTASFLAVLIASHLCLVVHPLVPDIIPAQKISYGYVMRVAAYTLPILCWVLLPVLRVHELEAIVLLYVPEALCFTFAYVLQFTTLLLRVATVACCSVGGVGYPEH
jgi:hypothetical protein